MEPNPYEAPKESGEFTVRSGLTFAVLLLLAMPSACICGGITCYAVGVAGEMSAAAVGYEEVTEIREAGWLVGIPIGLVVLALVAFFIIRFGSKRL
jgi:hypothetical protein